LSGIHFVARSANKSVDIPAERWLPPEVLGSQIISIVCR
jgi:hypothetical protein